MVGHVQGVTVFRVAAQQVHLQAQGLRDIASFLQRPVVLFLLALIQLDPGKPVL